MRILIALVLVTTMACSKKKEGGAADNPCTAAVERGVDQTIAKRRAGNTQPMTPEEQEVPKKLKVALAKSCVDDKWAADVIDCYKTADDIATCKEKLTPEQRAAYTRAAMGVMQGARGSGGMPPHGMPPSPGSMGATPAGSGGAPPSTDTPPTPPSPPPPPPSGSGSN